MIKIKGSPIKEPENTEAMGAYQFLLVYAISHFRIGDALGNNEGGYVFL